MESEIAMEKIVVPPATETAKGLVGQLIFYHLALI